MSQVVLREVTEPDLDIFFEHQQDFEAQWAAAFTSEDPTHRAAFDTQWTRMIETPTIRPMTIVVDGEVAGHLASFVAPWSGDRELTYWLGRQHWGKGIATQALAEFLKLETTRPIYARSAFDNIRSIRVLKKCGFEVCGTAKGFAKARGVEIEEVVLKLEPAAATVKLE